MRAFIPLTAALLFLFCGCENNSAEDTPDLGRSNAEASEGDRDSWQKPEQLLRLMEGFVKDRKVADLFAGDGYFTFKLVDAGARVIAIDTDPANIEALEVRKKELGLSDEQLMIRKTAIGEPGLEPEEVDAAIIVHAYGRIPDRKGFFKKLRNGMKAPRPVYIVDWQYRQSPVGPPVAERIPMDRFLDELSLFGYSGVGAQADKMPYQVIYLATDQLDTGEEEFEMQLDEGQAQPK